MHALKLFAVAATGPLALCGCATVINGTSQDYQMMSTPPGATVRLSSGQSCATPCEMSLKRRNDLEADMMLAGFKAEKVYIQSRTGGAGAGNLLLGGLIGAGVDASNGSMNSLYPRPLSVKLAHEGTEEEAMLLDKDGSPISTIAAHNLKVMADVQKGLAEQRAKAAKKSAKGTK